MTKLNKKILALVIIAFSALLLVPIANAAAPTPPTLMAWTDKQDYAPGETGTLYFVFYNGGDAAVTIQKIFIMFYEWWVYRNAQWEGNQTIALTPAGSVGAKGIYEASVTFTVPADGRAETTDVGLRVQTAEAGDFTNADVCSVIVATTPRFMGQIVTLLTIQVVLIIVCTVIIAATIFLSMRRPQVTWKAEEKAQ